jgi:hypothetical protein
LSRRWYERTSGGRRRRPAIEEQLEKAAWKNKTDTKLWIANICQTLIFRRTYIEVIWFIDRKRCGVQFFWNH